MSKYTISWSANDNTYGKFDAKSLREARKLLCEIAGGNAQKLKPATFRVYDNAAECCIADGVVAWNGRITRWWDL